MDRPVVAVAAVAIAAATAAKLLLARQRTGIYAKNIPNIAVDVTLVTPGVNRQPRCPWL